MISEDNTPYQVLIEKYDNSSSYKEKIMFARLAAEAARKMGNLQNEMIANFSEGLCHLYDLKNYEDALKNFTWILSQIENKSDAIALTDDTAQLFVGSFAAWLESASNIPSISEQNIDTFLYATDNFIENTGLIECKPQTLHYRSNALIKFCRFNDALLCAEEALALKRMNLDSPGCELYCYLASYSNLLRLKGCYTDALEVISECIEEFEGAEAYNDRGWLYFQLGNYTASINDFDEALFIEEDTGYYKKRALAYAMLGDLDKAIADLKGAFKKEKRNIEISLWLAGISNQFGHLNRLKECEDFYFNLVKFYLEEIDENALLELANNAPIEKKIKEQLCISNSFIGLLKESRNNKKGAMQNYKHSLNTDCIWILEYDWSKAKLAQLG